VRGHGACYTGTHSKIVVGSTTRLVAWEPARIRLRQGAEMIEFPTMSAVAPVTASIPAPAVGPRRTGSLRRRLPLAISLFLIAIVGAGGGASYYEVRQAVLVTAKTRLQNNARQWGRLMSQTTVQRLEESRRAAAHPALQQRLVAADPATVDAARADLTSQLAAFPQNLSVELWTAAGERLEAVFAGGTPDGPAFPRDASVTPPHGVGTQPMRVQGDLLYSELVAAVTGAAGVGGAPAKGFLVFRRRITSPTAGQAIARLIGDGNAIRVGSRETGVWTDLSRRVAAPPPAPAGEVIAYRPGGGAPQLGVEVPIAGLPWSLWVETPESVALAPAYAFWNAMLPIGALFVVLGAGLAWIIGRRITTPLSDLTAAAEAVAAGDLSRRVRADRTDEVGRLADAFNVMTDQVQAGYTRLDAGIRSRTAELEEALAALEDTQEQLIRREKLAMLGQLASGVGHELRNPLGVMTNAVYYLEMVQPDAPPDVRDYHGLLRGQIGLAEKIVGDLLDFSRVRPPRREPIALADVVAAQRARLSVPAAVTMRIAVPEDLPRPLADDVQIGQIVLNLFVNAVQAVDARGGTITVTGTADADHVRLHVQDDGAGVPEAVRAKIFEPLFTTKARGIGLGLAVSRSLAENNGGTLVLDETGAGASFTLSLPRPPAAEAP
jgi:signal transduction histidine kinase